MKSLFLIFMTILLSVFANEDSQGSEIKEDNTDTITIIVMSIVFGSVIIVSLIVALVLFIQQRRRKADEYNTL